jgi:hypothetical protein
MKKADWVFLLTAAAIAVAIWYFFIRRSSPTSVVTTSTRAEPNQNHIVGSGIVEPDASEFAAGHYNIDYTSLYP